MIISSCKMAATARKADYHLRLVQIKLRKIVCKPLWTKCASISNYLIHVMLSASPAPRRYAVDPLISCTIHAHVNITHYHMTATARKADYHLRLVQIKLRKIVCKPLWTKCASISNYLILLLLICSLRKGEYA